MVIHQAGNYTVEKLADKHYVIIYEDEHEVKIVATYKNETSAVKKAEQLSKQ